MLLAPLLALAVTVIAIHALRRPAAALGLVDRPCRRKRHEGVVPLTGGLALATGWLVGFWASGSAWIPFWPLGVGGALLLVIGVLDDRFGLPAYPRLLAQLLVGVLMLIAGVQVSWLGNLLGFGEIGLNVFAIPFTVLAVALMINALNMMDGMDGLSGGVAFLALCGLSTVAFGVGQGQLGLAALLLILALTGFLAFNVRMRECAPARVFLGDSGSMLLGFALAWFAVALAGERGGGVAPITVAWFLVLPAADSLAVMLRRALHRRSPFAPDRTHLHHILLRSGHSVRGTWGTIMAAQTALVAAGLAGHFFHVPEPVQAVLVTMVLVGGIGFSLRAAGFLRRARRRSRRAFSTVPRPAASAR